MKEQDFIDLNFEKVVVPPHESGDENTWHYYVRDICGISLITPTSDDAKDGEWYVEFFESYPPMRIKEHTQLSTLIGVLEDIMKTQD